MFYISLPFFYENYIFNNFFKNYIQSNKDKLIANFSIEYVYGAFPWSYWAGGTNPHTNKAVLVPEMEYVLNHIKSPLRLDCSNCFLNQNDFYDTHMNACLDIIKNTGAAIEISSIDLLKYIQEHDQYAKFIISNYSEIYNDYNEDIINCFITQPEIELLTLNNNNYKMSVINDLNKIEIIIGGCSTCSHEQQLVCWTKEHNYIYDYSGMSSLYKCSKIPINIDYYAQIKSYLPHIKHFKIMPHCDYLDLLTYISYEVTKK